jgi:membrane protein DedA with SNARE-associated domain
MTAPSLPRTRVPLADLRGVVGHVCIPGHVYSIRFGACCGSSVRRNPPPERNTATVTHFFTHHGLPLLSVVVMIESFGIPLPGETALIAFGVLASQGHYSIGSVIVAATAGAIVGDNLGYWLIGRLGGRALFRRWRWLNRYSDRVLPRTEALMERHGGKTVFFGRFVSVLRYTVAWIAGLSRMHWWKFLFWNAAGGIAWATAVGLIAYYSGRAAATAIQRYGLYAAAGVALAIALGWIIIRHVRRRAEERL